jgi:hypothetical protein
MSASRDQADSTPLSISHAEPRWYGVPPPLALLLLATGCFAAALALLATGAWPYGLILLGLGVLLLVAFLEVARRRPDSQLTAYAAMSAAAAREQTTAALDRLRARSSAAVELQRVRGAVAAVESDRRGALLRLGEAVHREDEAGEELARRQLAELAAIEAELGTRLAERLASTEERIRRSRLSVQRTMVVKPVAKPDPDERSGRPAP